MLPAFLFGFTASFISTYLISFDRLLSVLFPMWSVYVFYPPPYNYFSLDFSYFQDSLFNLIFE
ncbi:unnamed protein product [Meloidogyne enterolobii]|uniref:Uncharacterized protein n=1 Tax=Meloidogyne enterolobii TaxID=390850 RepID=A0ACB0ZXD6_MELEN